MDMKVKGTLPLGLKICSSKSQNKTQDIKSTEKTCRTFDCCFKRILKAGIYGNAGGSAAVVSNMHEGLGFTWFLGYLFLVRHLILRYGKRKTALFRYQNKEKLSSTDDHRELKNP
uniref:Uncharacterized protein n=1 Tax=Populus trichocarpa TaxID=3694 RepID=U7DZF9_POPTR